MTGDRRYWLREHKGTLLAFAAFVAMFAIYATNHPAGFNANVATTAADKGVLLAIVAMAQTLVVLTSGIDLSVGMVMVLANCLASEIVVGSPLTTALGVVGVLLVGCLCGAINGLIVIFGRLQPIVTTIATGAVYYGAALALRPVPGGGDRVASLSALGDRTRGVRGRLVRGCRVHVGRADPAREARRVHAVGSARLDRRGLPKLRHVHR